MGQDSKKKVIMTQNVVVGAVRASKRAPESYIFADDMSTVLAALVDFAIYEVARKTKRFSYRAGSFTSEKAQALLESRCRNGTGTITSIRNFSGFRLRGRVHLDLRVEGHTINTTGFDRIYGRGTAQFIFDERMRVVSLGEQPSLKGVKTKPRNRTPSRNSRNKLHRRCPWQFGTAT